MLPTLTHSTGNGRPSSHPHESRGWTAYNDDKRRKGDSWLAGLGRASLPGFRSVDNASWKSVVSRVLGVSTDEFDTRTAWSVVPSVMLPSLATVRFILLCALWYMSSALSSNTGKAIMTRFRYPVTLTFIQFGFVAGYCLLFASPVVRFTKLREPTAAIIRTTLPMALFQVGGHVFSSIAIARIPVSTVHTIKALSPLFTVATYALLFGVSYTAKTYISLLPLTVGVMLACSFDMSASNLLGLTCAFGSALVFVSSNIFFKKIMPSPSAGHGSTTSAHKLDKLNLLFYSSGLAFITMVPIWMYYDLGPLWSLWTSSTSSYPGASAQFRTIAYYFFLNGTVHWAQNIIAFAILASTSPVTYSIASLIKRIAVIIMAIVWFRQAVHPVQGFGISLTFIGLWMYNQAKGDVERGENKVRRVEAARNLDLPSTKADTNLTDGPEAVSSSLFRSRALSVPISTFSVPNGHHAGPHMRSPPSHPPCHQPTPIHIPPGYSKGTPLRGPVTSPIEESYPSPPPSIDSPPPITASLQAPGNVFSRRTHDKPAALSAYDNERAGALQMQLPIAIAA